ncbi:hypothetical protein FIM1_2065 [Kluyveromyces marxianus]|uniref:Transmembrane protein n=1 Tax=Kluyveromyces marxianus TaxID=4911 RepID=A0ABX6ESU1_KLUMA|nr:hypothetical protein FIM1_2065 [Kluyveromyces marxianus]
MRRTHTEKQKKGEIPPEWVRFSTEFLAPQRAAAAAARKYYWRKSETEKNPLHSPRNAQAGAHGVFLSFSFLNVVLCCVFFFFFFLSHFLMLCCVVFFFFFFGFRFSLLTLLWAGRRPFLFGRRWFRLDGGSCWANAESREGAGFFFSSLSVCVLWCGTQQEFNLFSFFRCRNFSGVVTLVTDGLGQGNRGAQVWGDRPTDR